MLEKQAKQLRDVKSNLQQINRRLKYKMARTVGKCQCTLCNIITNVAFPNTIILNMDTFFQRQAPIETS